MIKGRQVRGFTLIELLIVVAVVAILAAIAYPAYTDSILKGRRAQARTALLELMQQQERYITQRNTYLAFSNAAGVTDPTPVPFKIFAGDSSTAPPYWLSSGTCDSTQLINECVMLTATPTANDAAVGSLSLTSTGLKRCTGSAKDSNPKLCWP